MALSDQDFAAYDGSQVIISLLGKTIQGKADGPFLRVRFKSPLFSSKNGVDALVSRSAMNDWRAEVDVILEQTSSSNAVLSAIAAAARLTRNGRDVGPLLVTDMSGFSVYQATKAWITKMPDVEYARETGQLVWTLECARMIPVFGGN